ncbi:MAG: hypothetical protein U5M23_03100 [Marinagarivorans sp.]|nr:hypothetical protein [Marinagarivorans sp.]
MNMLRADLLEKFDIELAESFNPIATYNKSLDFIEYLSVDATCVSRRIDEHLTLLLDMDNELELIGFKLKGFACIYGEIMQNAGIENHQAQFSGIVEILVELISKMGDKMFPAQKAEYARVIKFASKKDVKLDMNSLKVA